eukprot:762863-Hanusia_phi.AAC.2
MVVQELSTVQGLSHTHGSTHSKSTCLHPFVSKAFPVCSRQSCPRHSMLNTPRLEAIIEANHESGSDRYETRFPKAGLTGLKT